MNETKSERGQNMGVETQRDATTDVVIIGAGPVGLFSIFECGMLKLKCHVVDALSFVGGQCVALYPEKPLYDIPAWPEITGADLISKLSEQIKPFHPVFHLEQMVTDLTACQNVNGKPGWEIKTTTGARMLANCVIIAAGVGAFGPNRPPLEGIEAFEDVSVFYHVRKKEIFRDKTVMIAGGGDSALDWALALSSVAKKVLMVHRRPKFRGAPESVRRLENLAQEGKIDLIVPYQLHGLEGDSGEGILKAVTLQDLEGNEVRYETDFLLPFFGLSMNLGPIAQWGLGLDRNHIVVDPASCQTSTPGIFAIGDIATYPGKLKLILTGFSEGAIAAHGIYGHIFPGEVYHFEYSTTKGLPGK